MSIVVLFCSAVFFLAGIGEPVQAADQPITWRIQTAVPSASIYYELLQRYGAWIDKMSGGRLKTEVLPDGAVVQAFEILDAVDQGIVEGGFAWTHYWSGKHPAGLLFSAPIAGAGVGLDQMSHMAWLFEGGGYELYQKFWTDILKLNIKAFMLQPMGPDPLGWFKKPINSLEEFTKFKYRAPPGIVSEVFKEVGVPAVSMPGGEIVPSAQRGVIDAGEWIGPADDMLLGFYTVWKHYYLQGLHQATDVGDVYINKDFWNKLSPDLQAIVEAAAMLSIADTWNFNVWRNAQAVKLLQEKHGVTIHDTPKDFYPELVKASQKVLEKYAAKDPFFKEVLDSQRKFAEVVVPYWTKVLELYYNIGEAALKAKGK